MRIFKDGNKWCALESGKNLQNGFAVFADSEEDAKSLFRAKFFAEQMKMLMNNPPKFTIHTLCRFIDHVDMEVIEDEYEMQRLLNRLLPCMATELYGIIEDKYEQL